MICRLAACNATTQFLNACFNYDVHWNISKRTSKTNLQKALISPL